MTIVIADTGPLNYLILIRHIDILEHLYGDIVIPPAVQDEMLSPLAPEAVRSWLSNPPRWLEVRTPGRIDERLSPSLDEGEREAITLAQNSGADTLLLIDERRGRREAARLGLEMIGTLGVLEEAHELGLLDMREAIERLKATSFKGSDELYQKFLDRI